MSGAPASGSSSGEEEDDADRAEAMPATLPTASRGYSAPGRSPASTTAAGAIVPTVVVGMSALVERTRQKALSLSLSCNCLTEEEK